MVGITSYMHVEHCTGFQAMENLANSTNSLTSSITGSISTPLLSSYQMDAALQNTLKRVSREVQQRKTGQKDSKQPLPPVSLPNEAILI